MCREDWAKTSKTNEGEVLEKLGKNSRDTKR